MTTLKDARKGQMDQFIKEHDCDSKGDLNKLDAALKRPVRETASTTRKALLQASPDD